MGGEIIFKEACRLDVYNSGVLGYVCSSLGRRFYAIPLVNIAFLMSRGDDEPVSIDGRETNIKTLLKEMQGCVRYEDVKEFAERFGDPRV